MPDCDYQQRGDVWVCVVCGDHRSAAVHRNCQAPPEKHVRPHLAGSLVAKLPEESQRLLIGDRIKQLTDALGIPQCGDCAARQAWLNDAHRWALRMWGSD